METLASGMLVHSLDDRCIGSVSAIHRCCFQFERTAAGAEESVTATGIFNVQTGVVTLICYEAEAQRYGCPIHPPVMKRSGRSAWTPRPLTHSGQLAAARTDTIAHRRG